MKKQILFLSLSIGLIFSFSTKAQTLKSTTTDIPVTGIKINTDSIGVRIDRISKLTATVLPDSASNKNMTWLIRNTTIADINTSGQITGKTVGKTYAVAITAEGAFHDSCLVDVRIPVTSVIIPEPRTFNIAVGDTVRLHATVLPENATYKTIIWKHVMPHVISIDANGLVTGIGEGEVVVAPRNIDTFGVAYVINVTSATDAIQDIDILNSHVKCYPNPANTQMEIVHTKGLGIIEIYNTTGQKVFVNNYGKQTSATIPVQDFPAGIYLIKSNGEVTKLIKE